MNRRPTVSELEALLRDDGAGVPITILPNGEIRAEGHGATIENAPPQVERVAWAIAQALHSNVPEGDRPQGWADFSTEQEARIRRAAEAAIAASAPQGMRSDLMRHYGVSNIDDLVAAQDAHIASLQEKVRRAGPPLVPGFPAYPVREG